MTRPGHSPFRTLVGMDRALWFAAGAGTLALLHGIARVVGAVGRAV